MLNVHVQCTCILSLHSKLHPEIWVSGTYTQQTMHTNTATTPLPYTKLTLPIEVRHGTKSPSDPTTTVCHQKYGVNGTFVLTGLTETCPTTDFSGQHQLCISECPFYQRGPHQDRFIGHDH